MRLTMFVESWRSEREVPVEGAARSPAPHLGTRSTSLQMATSDMGDLIKQAKAAPEQQQAQLLGHLLASLEAQPQAVLVSLRALLSREGLELTFSRHSPSGPRSPPSSLEGARSHSPFGQLKLSDSRCAALRLMGRSVQRVSTLSELALWNHR